MGPTCKWCTERLVTWHLSGNVITMCCVCDAAMAYIHVEGRSTPVGVLAGPPRLIKRMTGGLFGLPEE